MWKIKRRLKEIKKYKVKILKDWTVLYIFIQIIKIVETTSKILPGNNKSQDKTSLVSNENKNEELKSEIDDE